MIEHAGPTASVAAWLTGISQAELAERMGVDRAYISGLELGQRNPTVVTLWHIAKALDVKLGPIFDGERAQRRRTP
ncbi:MAG TPA: helix-turn-helix transcriptional regulator [Xanthobacteraceae bacterium]